MSKLWMMKAIKVSSLRSEAQPEMAGVFVQHLLNIY